MVQLVNHLNILILKEHNTLVDDLDGRFDRLIY